MRGACVSSMVQGEQAHEPPLKAGSSGKVSPILEQVLHIELLTKPEVCFLGVQQAQETPSYGVPLTLMMTHSRALLEY